MPVGGSTSPLIRAAAQTLVIQPADAAAIGIDEHRLAEKSSRRAKQLIDTLTALDPAPLHQPRMPEARVIGTCRHFATLACAFLRTGGISAHWDEWGRMTEAYEGRTGPTYDQLVDDVAATCAEGDPLAVARLCSHEDLAVPDRLVS